MFEVFARRVKALTVIEFIADTMVCFAAVLVASNRVSVGDSVHAEPEILLWAAMFAGLMSLMYSCVGLYRRYAIAVSVWTLVRRALMAVAAGAAIAFVGLRLQGQSNNAGALVFWAVFYIAIGVLVVRSVVHAVHRSSLGVRRVLIVGTGAEAASVARDIEASGKGRSALVGFYPATADARHDVDGGHVFSTELSLERVVQDHKVDEIVVAVREQRGGSVPMGELLACRIRGTQVLDLAGFYEQVRSEVPTDSLKASWLVYGDGFAQSASRAFVKRCFDLLFSSLLLLMVLPIMLLTMIAIRLESRGPVFYRQERVGQGGRVFNCRKFRSMRTDAEKDGVARWATKNDSRITRVGKFIRKTRIDELPQLISVLCGEMSLVGPRPERPSFVAELREKIPFYDIRHSVKPGVTGWAQVRYGYCDTIEDSKRKHQFDLFYVKNNSFLLDLLVLIETVSVVLFREGSQ